MIPSFHIFLHLIHLGAKNNFINPPLLSTQCDQLFVWRDRNKTTNKTKNKKNKQQLFSKFKKRLKKKIKKITRLITSDYENKKINKL